MMRPITFFKNKKISDKSTAITMLLVAVMMPVSIYAADPIHLKDNPLNGQYIGTHIEYLSHQSLVDSLISRLDLEDDIKEKIRSGNLVSDEKITVDVTWTSTGYRARFHRIGKKDGNDRVFEVGINDLKKKDIFSQFTASSQPILNLNFHPRPYWLRFKVINNGDEPVDFLMELDKYLFEYINIYIPEQNGFVMKRQAFASSLDQREIKHKHFVFKLSAGAGETIYYMFVSSWNKRTKDSIPLRVWSPDNFIRHASDDGLFSGIVMGLFLLVFFYNVCIFVFVRDSSYLYLSLVTLCQMALEVSASGTGFFYLWPDNPLFTWQILFQNTALVMCFNLLFYRSFIGISRYTPRLDRALVIMSWIFFVCALSSFVLPQKGFETMLWFLFIMDHLYSLPILIPTVIALKNKNRSGVFVLIGIFFYYLGLLKFQLTGSGTLPYGMLNYLPVKGLSFLIIMTLGLAHKYNMMKQSVMDLNVNLEQRVIERTEKLKQANAKLRELDTLKTRFFDNISHEFRTPLTLITAPIESLLAGEYGKLPKPCTKVLSSMKTNAERLLRLISDLLDFSKIEAGKMDVTLKNCDIAGFLSYCVSSMDSIARSKTIKISFQDHTGGLVAPINTDLMEKAVLNLLSNAIKFNRPNGMISVVLEKNTYQFSISIKDSGTGIPADRLDTIFDRFTQVDSSSTRRHEGSGIDLSLTREIVELHGGDIHAASSIGEGSVFIVTIPNVDETDTKSIPQYQDYSDRQRQNPESQTESPAEPAMFGGKKMTQQNTRSKESPLKTKTILVVEDNDDMRNYLKGFLEKHYRIASAVNGKQALKILKKQEVHLVLSDLMMPEMDGYGLTRAIRANESYENLPVILLTAKSHAPDKIKGFEKGANDYIIKPFNAEEVLARIRSHLKIKSLRDRLVRANLNLKGQKKILTESSKLKIEMVKTFLDENFYEDISRDDLASVAQMSPDHMGKMFKQFTGEKISGYINQRRIKEALRQLKQTDAKVIDIAFDVGFGSLRSFNQVFRDLTGDTPSKYRKKLKD